MSTKGELSYELHDEAWFWRWGDPASSLIGGPYPNLDAAVRAAGEASLHYGWPQHDD